MVERQSQDPMTYAYEPWGSHLNLQGATGPTAQPVGDTPLQQRPDDQFGIVTVGGEEAGESVLWFDQISPRVQESEL